jgi:hypothetical protein
MAWTFPKTWFAGELVTADLLNTHLRDNLNVLHAPPKASYANNGCNYSTSSTSLVDVDSTNLTLSIDTTGGDVLVMVLATIQITGAAWTDRVNLAVTCDGELRGVRPQVTWYGSDSSKIGVCFFVVVSNLTIWTHDFALRWSIGGATSANMSQVAMLVREIG